MCSFKVYAPFLHARFNLFNFFFHQEEIATEHYVETEETRYELTNLAPFSVYTIWVAALNSNGPGINSVEARVRTYSSAPTKPPQSVTAKPFSSSVLISFDFFFFSS